MKKLVLTLCAFCAALLVSCGGSVSSQAADIYNDATDDVKSAKTLEELDKIKKDTDKKLEDLIKSMSEEDMAELFANPELSKDADAAEDAYKDAARAKRKELRENK